MVEVPFADRLSIPAVAAPMLLGSGPALVTACCRSGVVGTFPALNQRSTEGFAAWLEQIEAQVRPTDAPFGVNLIVHKTNPRLQPDLDQIRKHRVPIVISSMGAAKEVVDAVHSYGGLSFHDVTGMRHAEKAIEAGVDGIVLVAAGAGGHAGTLSPFALIGEVRAIYDGIILLGGAISRGEDIAAAQMMGADLAYMGTRFLATQESLAGSEQKDMMVRSHAGDIVYTPAISGVPASFLRESIEAAGLDPANVTVSHSHAMDVEQDVRPGAKAWKEIWSAGQGVGAIDDSPPVEELVARLSGEYRRALDKAAQLRAALAAA